VEERAKSPVVVGGVSVAEVCVAVRLVRTKRLGPLVLLMGTGPKSCVAGVRTRPVRARPVPVRVRT
jgi:hypothetical protein